MPAGWFVVFGTLVICLVKILSLETKYLFSRNDEEMKKNVKLGRNHTRNNSYTEFSAYWEYQFCGGENLNQSRP